MPIAVLALAALTLVVGGLLLSRKFWSRRLHLAAAGGFTPQPETLAADKPPDRRQSPRRWGMPIEVFLADPASPAKPIRGWIVNRSPGGLGLSVSGPVPVGTVLHLRITHAPDSLAWTAVEIKSCYFQVNRWLLGSQFVEMPEREILLMFG